MILINVFKHTMRILKHKYFVFKYCCKLGIPWRGLLHDLSKFSPTEFIESIKYYQDGISPIDVCKKKNGYSKAWFHLYRVSSDNSHNNLQHLLPTTSSRPADPRW